jgi:hypothetical protein
VEVGSKLETQLKMGGGFPESLPGEEEVEENREVVVQ